jgi:hypothetical protein
MFWDVSVSATNGRSLSSIALPIAAIGFRIQVGRIIDSVILIVSPDMEVGPDG